MIGPRSSPARWAIPAVVALLALVFVVQGANRPTDPYLGASASSGATGGGSDSGPEVREPLEGFGQVAFRVDASNVAFGARSVALRCALLAETPEQLRKGLMGQPDLSGYDGMLFRLDRDQNVAFVMTNTLIPLTLAFFDSSGRFVASTDMATCLDQPVCPTYAAPKPYRMAMEVRQGRLASLGIGPGARLVLEEGRAC